MGVIVATILLGAAYLVLPWLWDNVFIVGRRLWATRHIPEPPGSLWLGHIPAFVGSRYRPFRLLHAWSLEWGPLFRVRFFGRPVVVVTDPELYQPLLRGPQRLPKYTAPYRMFEVFTSPERSNILTSPEHATWKAVRSAAVAALTMNNLRLCFPHITAVTQRLIHTLAAAGPSAVHDMDRVAAGITVDVIGLAAFNRDLQATCTLPPSTPATAATTQPQQQHQGPAAPSSTSSSVQDSAGGSGSPGSQPAEGICGSVLFPRGREVLDVIGHLVVAMQARNNPLNRWFPSQAYRDLFYWGGRMSGLVQDLTASMEAHPPPAHSLGAHLLNAKYPDGRPLDRDQIMAEIGIMWGAGFETTAHTICWTLFLLATHPEAEARLVAELDSLGLLATADRPQPSLTWEHLGQLKYLSAVVNESMRLYPVVSSGTIRITNRPTVLAGHSLPAGQPILIPFYAVHRSPQLWQDPDSFRPERFLSTHMPTPPTTAAGAGAAAAGAAGAAGASASTPRAAAATAAGASRGEGLGVSDNSDDDYVDVAADLAADTAAARDQDWQQGSSQGQQKHVGSSGSSSAMPTAAAAADTSGKARRSVELKDPTVDRRGFLPFALGPRNCVGQALALVELKAVLALLLGAFSFDLHPSMGGFEGVDASAKQTVTLSPQHGLLMTLTPRVAQQ